MNVERTASEIGLIQNDSPSGFDKGSMARILGINLELKTSVQYAYLVDAVERPVGQNIKKGMSALSDVLVLDLMTYFDQGQQTQFVAFEIVEIPN